MHHPSPICPPLPKTSVRQTWRHWDMVPDMLHTLYGWRYSDYENGLWQVSRDSLIRVKSFIHMLDVIRLRAWHDSSICVMWLINVRDMKNPVLCHVHLLCNSILRITCVHATVQILPTHNLPRQHARHTPQTSSSRRHIPALAHMRHHMLITKKVLPSAAPGLVSAWTFSTRATQRKHGKFAGENVAHHQCLLRPTVAGCVPLHWWSGEICTSVSMQAAQTPTK